MERQHHQHQIQQPGSANGHVILGGGGYARGGGGYASEERAVRFATSRMEAEAAARGRMAPGFAPFFDQAAVEAAQGAATSPSISPPPPDHAFDPIGLPPVSRVGRDGRHTTPAAAAHPHPHPASSSPSGLERHRSLTVMLPPDSLRTP